MQMPVLFTGVEPAELRDAFRNHALRGFWIADVVGDSQDIRIVRRLDRPCRRHEAVVELARCLDDVGSYRRRCGRIAPAFEYTCRTKSLAYAKERQIS